MDGTRTSGSPLACVVDAVVDAGYVDRNKMGIGGHSYGAFSTVNALTLVPYFKAGIAGDGPDPVRREGRASRVA